MKLYKATEADIDRVSDLFNEYRVFYNQPSDLEGAKRFIRDRMDYGDSVIFVAVKDDAYVGFIQLYPSLSSISMRRTWVLNDLYVVENMRNQGIAQKLINEAIVLCSETNAIYLSLQTAPNNQAAQRLYEKNHFILDSEYYSYTLRLG